MQNSKQNIRNLNFPEVKAQIEALGEKSFRAKQVFEWLWKEKCRFF